MNVAQVVPGFYNLRSDIVEVVRIAKGKTPRSATVHYVVRAKNRPRSHLDAGDAATMGIANFASWATPVRKPKMSPNTRGARRRAD
jgi:hypothetical protein